MMVESFQEISCYNPSDVCAFRKVDEQFGAFSNMSNAFKVRVNGMLIFNTEALYQACRYPHLIEVQKEILNQKSGLAAKMKSKPHRKTRSREDWDAIKVEVMWWCLRAKLGQNVFAMGKLLESTGDMEIVEHSHNDQFWGATLDKDGVLRGQNVLGKLLMRLREEYQNGIDDFRVKLSYVEPPEIENFLLLGNPVLPVGRKLEKAA
jgi:ribA/ribD-fused uncharacterized protein